MKTSLEHLPPHKQQELKRAVEIIEEVATPAMLILFGSYARAGDWVEELADDGVHYKYQSDFDLLAVVKNEALAVKIERKDSLHNRLHREVKTPVSLIAEDIHFVNRRLSKGQYFYTDILREGILLLDSGEFELAEPRELNAQDRKQLAQQDFDYWYKNATDFFKYHRIALQEGDLNKSAFFLHQAVESFYSTLLLVYTRYKPSSHDLQKLGQLVSSIEPKCLTVFPQGAEQERHRFELLRKAYVNARYKPAYTITDEELQWLAQRVSYLQTLTEELCKQKIETFS